VFRFRLVYQDGGHYSRSYDYSERLELRRIAVEAWTAALFMACDAAWKKHKPGRLNRRRHETR